ncbi:MAG: zinc-dependent metalloprotease [Pseudomonadota bacterium]
MIIVGALSAAAWADDYSDKTAGLDAQAGVFDIHAAPAGGKLLATLPAPDTSGAVGRYIYATRLRAGLGSNPVGLDRGAGDSGILVALRQVGEQLVIEAINTDYRASADNVDEQRAVRESFASSVLWTTPILARDAEGRLLVDLSAFLVRDHLGIAAQLKRTGQGSFRLDANRSFVDGEQLAFPDNVELEATLTFASAEPGSEVWATAADARAVSLVLHHTFVRLPEPGFRQREWDPRSAAISVDFYDFSQPLSGSLVRRLARRYRLEKTDPTAARSPVKKPIVFYVDPGAPEPIRSALIEGASWWGDAFEAAGFEDAYRVEVLPEGAHPLDVRYNVIQWVHRQTRGWSYGGGVADPRTGEMLKGHVILGSQRVRQDRMIFEGLAGRDGVDAETVALARIRQLSAHEVGHSLGFAHNMAASADDRASVMDYPAPLITVNETGAMDFSAAYASGMGAWDDFTVAWLYSEFAPGADEQTGLVRLIDSAYGSGLHFVADQHARPIAAAHPRGSLWDNGDDAVAFLEETMRVRELALADFSLDRLAPGQSVANLQTVFAPIYLYHRYQVQAAAKFVGGARFDYDVAGGDVTRVETVASADQRRALEALAATLKPEALAISDRVLALMQPPLDSREPILGRERIESRRAPLFDPLAAAGAAARLTLGAVLDGKRMARVALQHGRDAEQLGPDEVFQTLSRVVFAPGSAAPQVQYAVQWQYVTALATLDGDADADAPVRAAARLALVNARQQLGNRRLAQSAAERDWLARVVQRYLDSGEWPGDRLPARAEIPPGSPIGSGSNCWHCDSATLIR